MHATRNLTFGLDAYRNLTSLNDRFPWVRGPGVSPLVDPLSIFGILSMMLSRFDEALIALPARYHVTIFGSLNISESFEHGPNGLP